ncbi:MAG TPA: D-alanyl-D-alanine carboxypeptidase [Blastocatellia bacterium]|nr:D-alanyl-D-alanine carboxypeptidase [Blastocatellia bacterium]
MAKFASGTIARPKDYKDPRSLNQYVDRLTAEGHNWKQHGVYVETFDKGTPVAMLNESTEFNPASVTKLATTLAALDKLGQNYRFHTELRADGEVNPQTGVLQGDLMLLSGGDPSFSLADAQRVGEALQKVGIRQVDGSLVVVGDFTCDEKPSNSASAAVFSDQSGLLFSKPPRYESFDRYRPRGYPLMTIESDSLLKIVHYLNAHSINAMAEMLASHIGGPKGVQNFLVNKIGVPPETVYISHASGLEINRITPRDTVKMLRQMMYWASENQLVPSAVMAVAGIDAGTLRGRFAEGKFSGSVVAKTGTLHTTDTGVAALAGIMYTRGQGPLLFAVYDIADGKKVSSLRRIQDEFLKQLMLECGGPDQVAGRERNHAQDQPQSKMILAN